MLHMLPSPDVVIIAPHGDDEIIGCAELLLYRERLQIEQICVIYVNEPRYAHRPPIDTICQLPVDKLYDYLMSLPGLRLILVPDPAHEMHPLHRACGHLGSYINYITDHWIGYYTTQMNTNYVDLFPDPEKKRQLLDTCYPHKATLWTNDWKYFLYEGVRLVPKPTERYGLIDV